MASLLKQHGLKVDEMKFALENQGARVDNFESYLDKNKAHIEQIKDQLENNVIELSDKIKVVHGDMTKIVQDIGSRQNKIDSLNERFQERLDTCVETNEMVDKRTKDVLKKFEKLTIQVDKLQIEKQEKENF